MAKLITLASLQLGLAGFDNPLSHMISRHFYEIIRPSTKNEQNTAKLFTRIQHALRHDKEEWVLSYGGFSRGGCLCSWRSRPTETRKTQLTQKGTRSSDACLKAQFFYSHQRAPDDRRLIIYSVLLVLTKGRDLSRSANAVSAENRKFSLPLLI